jgi:hypothetical protein
VSNPVESSILVTAATGSDDFVQAVRQARSEQMVMFAFAQPSQLVAALPDQEKTMNVAPSMLQADKAKPLTVTSYFGTVTGIPVLSSMAFPKFEGSQEDLLASQEFESYWQDLAAFIQKPGLSGHRICR